MAYLSSNILHGDLDLAISVGVGDKGERPTFVGLGDVLILDFLWRSTAPSTSSG